VRNHDKASAMTRNFSKRVFATLKSAFSLRTQKPASPCARLVRGSFGLNASCTAIWPALALHGLVIPHIDECATLQEQL